MSETNDDEVLTTVRGGSWLFSPRHFGIALRYASYRRLYDDAGLRVVRRVP